MLFLFLLLTIPKWTIGCYLAADNGLDYVVLSDIEEMKSIGSTSDIRVVIQVDRLDWAERYLVERDSLVLLEEVGDVNSGDPEVLKDFGRWLGSNFPAEHYMLVIWDHGDGWDKKGICYEGFSFISVAEGEFGEAIASIRSELGKNIDIILLDACLMQMIEVASEIYSYADYMVGSEQLVPLTGFPYDRILSMLTIDPFIDKGVLSDSIASFYVQYYDSIGVDAQCSSVDLFSFSSLVQSVKELIVLLRGNAQNPAILKARESVQTFNCATDPPPTTQDRYIDMCNFAEILTSVAEGELKSAAQEVTDIGLTMMVSKYTGESLMNSRGLSVWFPYTYSEFRLDYLKYRSLQYAEMTEWEKFVFLYYCVPDTIPPTVPEPLPAEISGSTYRVKWEESYDLTSVSEYELEELIDAGIFLEDGCEDFTNFDPDGFVVSDYQPYNGEGSYFTSSGVLISKQEFPEGIFSFFRHQRNGKLSIMCSPDLVDWNEVAVFSNSTGWTKESVDITEEGYVKFEFSGDGAWVYIDDIYIVSFADEEVVYKGINNSFTVTNRPNGDYYYRAKAADEHENISAWSEIIEVKLVSYLSPYNYPNPFNEGTNIVYDIPADGKLTIFTVSGSLVRKLDVKKENFSIYWDGKDENGEDVASGVYICRLKSGDITFIFKIACVR